MVDEPLSKGRRNVDGHGEKRMEGESEGSGGVFSFELYVLLCAKYLVKYSGLLFVWFGERNHLPRFFEPWHHVCEQ